MHLAASGRVIIQLSAQLAEGQILCDRKGTKIAKINELIGPIKKPFASATPLTNNIIKYVGKGVFASEEQPTTSKLNNTRRRKQ